MMFPNSEILFWDGTTLALLFFLMGTLGLVIGSFLNVCTYRLPIGQSIITPPSHCPSCSTRLKSTDLFPVLSYLWLGGRCRYCQTTISPRYAGVELLTAILFLWSLFVFGLSPMLVKALVLSAFLVVITFIDIDHHLILDVVLLWLAGAGIVLNVWTESVGMVDMLIAGLGGGGLFLLIAMLSHGGMGGGDVKFAAVIGLWLGVKLTVVALFIAFLLGGMGGIIVLALKLKGRKDYIPFGPFLAAGAWIGLLYGQVIIDWYLTKLF